MEQKNSPTDQKSNDRILDAAQKATDAVIQLFANVGVKTSYSAPIEAAGHTIITAAEAFILAGSGLGGGFGSPLTGTDSSTDISDDADDQKTMGGDHASVNMSGGGGGGGGGFAFSRPVATIIIDQNTVEIKPIIDWTKIGLAFLTTLGGMIFMWIRIIRTSKR